MKNYLMNEYDIRIVNSMKAKADEHGYYTAEDVADILHTDRCYVTKLTRDGRLGTNGANNLKYTRKKYELKDILEFLENSPRWAIKVFGHELERAKEDLYDVTLIDEVESETEETEQMTYVGSALDAIMLEIEEIEREIARLEELKLRKEKLETAAEVLIDLQ